MSSRRHFLKTAGLAGLAMTGGVTMAVAQALDADNNLNPNARRNRVFTTGQDALHAKRWGMVIDTRRFTTPESFRPIIEACHREHNVPDIPTDQNIKWIWTDLYHHAFTDDANGHLPPEVEQRQVFLLCNHCANPSCVRVCPAGATYKTEEGLVAIDYHRCIGCRFCMAACPYGSRSFNFQDPRPFLTDLNAAFPTRMRGVVEKCSFCPERLEKGRLPACVEASNGAIVFGDLDDPQSDVRQVLAQNVAMRRKPSLGTDPSVYYII